MESRARAQPRRRQADGRRGRLGGGCLVVCVKRGRRTTERSTDRFLHSSYCWLGWLRKEMWSAKSGFCATGLNSSQFTARTISLCQLLRMDCTAFLRIVQSNVGDGTIIMNNLIQYLKEKKDISVIAGVTKEIEYMLARGQLELPITLCFAASKGDDFLLRQLLKRGLDPNELDNYGRTALHIAASSGSEQCIRLLLENEADPNARVMARDDFQSDDEASNENMEW